MRLHLTALAAATFTAAACPSGAVPLPPGGTLVLVPYTDNLVPGSDYTRVAIDPLDPAWFGALLASQDASASRVTSGLDPLTNEVREDVNVSSGTLRSTVSDVGGLLTFGYVLEDMSQFGTVPAAVPAFEITGFAGLDVDLGVVGTAFDGDVDVEPPLIDPSIVKRSDDGDRITIRFNPYNLDLDLMGDDFSTGDDYGLLSGTSSEFRLRTDAPTFRRGPYASLDLFIETFSVVPTVALPGVLAPAPIPLPAGLPLLGMGLGALALARRRRA